MIIKHEFTPIPAGKMAAIVTYLEMRMKPPLRAEPAKPGEFSLRHAAKPSLPEYREIYRRVGEQWLWCVRRAMDDEALKAIIHDPRVEVHFLQHRGRDEGLLELDFREFPDVEIAFFGVTGTLVGTGAGRYLMNRALEFAWNRAPKRVTVNTRTLDHPRALEFYLRSGFTPYKRAVEIADDPRLHGVLPRSAAPRRRCRSSRPGSSVNFSARRSPWSR